MKQTENEITYNEKDGILLSRFINSRANRQPYRQIRSDAARLFEEAPQGHLHHPFDDVQIERLPRRD